MLQMIAFSVARPSTEVRWRFALSEGLDRGLTIVCRGEAGDTKLTNESTAAARLGSASTISTIYETFKNVKGM